MFENGLDFSFQNIYMWFNHAKNLLKIWQIVWTVNIERVKNIRHSEIIILKWYEHEYNVNIRNILNWKVFSVFGIPNTYVEGVTAPKTFNDQRI